MNRRCIVQMSARAAAMTRTDPAAMNIGRLIFVVPCLGLFQAGSLLDARPFPPERDEAGQIQTAQKRFVSHSNPIVELGRTP